MITILQGDVIEQLRTLPDESVHCCVTSPPYWGLRDYSTNGQIGLEKTPEEYVAKMVEVFREVRRVLRKDGTLWLNLGDSYASAPAGNFGTDMPKPADGGAYRENKPKMDWSATGLKPKDLCGIPWRVAFALQQPYYGGRIKSEIDRAWLAALVDGEGCITILEAKSPHGSGSSYPPVLQVRMCDRECIDKVMLLVGSDGKNPEQSPPSQGGQRPSYHWRIHGDKACGVIAEIYPWILIKRKQAIIAWNHQVIRNSYETKRGVTIPTAALEKQMICRELIQRLNKRESVDIPSWMSEPPLPISPGWYLRSDCIWAKPNPMPESVTDRPTKAHEYLFLLTKSANYFYDAEAIKEEAVYGENLPSFRGGGNYTNNRSFKNSDPFPANTAGIERPKITSRNKRSVWTVATAPYPEAHFATYPPDLIKPCILAGTSAKGCCAKCGSPWERIVERIAEKDYSYQPIGIVGESNQRGRRNGSTGQSQFASTNQWEQGCRCFPHKSEGLPIPCTVLDPFAGSGTTGAVALELGRRAILIELNPKYVELIKHRCNVTPGLQLAV